MTWQHYQTEQRLRCLGESLGGSGATVDEVSGSPPLSVRHEHAAYRPGEARWCGSGVQACLSAAHRIARRLWTPGGYRTQRAGTDSEAGEYRRHPAAEPEFQSVAAPAVTRSGRAVSVPRSPCPLQCRSRAGKLRRRERQEERKM